MAERKTMKRSTAGKKRTTKKTASSGKTARIKKPVKERTPMDPKVKASVKAICFATIGILIFLSYYFNLCGALGRGLKYLARGFLGNAAYLLPILVLVYAVHLIVKKTIEGYRGKYWLGIGMLVDASAMCHLYHYRQNIADGWFDGVRKIWTSAAESGIGGGMIGGVVTTALVKLVDTVGTGILLIALFLVLFTFLTERLPFKLLGQLYDKIVTAIREKQAERKAEQKRQAEEAEINEGAVSEVPTPKKKKGKEKTETQSLTQEEIDAINREQEEIIIRTPVETNLYDEDQFGLPEVLGEGEPVPEEPASEPAPKPEKPEDNSAIPVEIEEPEERIPYTFPTIDFLAKPTASSIGEGGKPEDLRQSAKKLVETLRSFGVEAKVLEVTRGPSVTRFELQPNVGVKVSKIVGLADDIALSLAAIGVRIEAPIPGKSAVGIEIPNSSVSTVMLREVLASSEFQSFPSKLAFGLGKDIDGNIIVADIAKMPHLLIAGATGSGKSVCINTLITSILYKADPNEVKLLLIDPKVVELGVYNGIPHLLIPVVTDPRKAAGALNWAVQEMMRRYQRFAEVGARKLSEYNKHMAESGERQMEQIVIIIDELADLMMVAPHDVEDAIQRLTQMARAAGMHLIIATQRPSVNVITGVIKSNIPSRLSFATTSQVDSRTILDMGGAEKLLGRGDMLFMPMGANKPTRIQGAFISDKEVEQIVDFVKQDMSEIYNQDVKDYIEKENQGGGNDDPGDADDLLPAAIEIVVEAGQASTSMIQRKLKVGYSRAGRLIDQMEERGIIGPHEGSKPRNVLISKQEYYEMSMNEE